MLHEEGDFKAHDALELYQQRWLPDGEPVSAVIVVHGFVEHSGRYAPLGAELTRHGHAVYALDLRGHGKSPGRRAFVRSFDEYVADLKAFVTQVRAEQPGKPLFLFGHSMGGAIVTLFAISQQPEIAGMILSAPGLQICDTVFPLLRQLAAFLGRFFPRLRLVKVGFSRISRDPNVIEQVKNDPLFFAGRFPARTASEILHAARRIQAQMELVNVPFLVLHGTGDLLTDPEGSRKLVDRAAATDKTLKLYPNLYHDLLNEPEKEQVIADLIEWLNARVGVNQG